MSTRTTEQSTDSIISTTKVSSTPVSTTTKAPPGNDMFRKYVVY